MHITFVFQSLLLAILSSSVLAQQPTGPDRCTKDAPYKGFFSNIQIYHDVQTYCAAVLEQEASTKCIGTTTSRITAYPAATITGEITKTTTVAAWTQTITSTAIVPRIHGFVEQQPPVSTLGPSFRLMKRAIKEAVTSSVHVDAIDYPSVVYSVCFCGSAIGDWLLDSQDQMCTVTSTITNEVYTRQARTVYVSVTAGATTLTETVSVTSVVNPQKSGYMPEAGDRAIWSQWDGQQSVKSFDTTPLVGSSNPLSTKTSAPIVSSTLDLHLSGEKAWEDWSTQQTQIPSVQQIPHMTSDVRAMPTPQSWLLWTETPSNTMANFLPTPPTTSSEGWSVSVDGVWQKWVTSTMKTAPYSDVGYPTGSVDTSILDMKAWEQWSIAQIATPSYNSYTALVSTHTSQIWGQWTTSALSNIAGSSSTNSVAYSLASEVWQEWIEAPSTLLTSKSVPNVVQTSQSVSWQQWTGASPTTMAINPILSTSSVQAELSQSSVAWHDWQQGVSSLNQGIRSSSVFSAAVTATMPSGFWQEWNESQNPSSTNDAWLLTSTSTHTKTGSAQMYTTTPSWDSTQEWVTWRHNFRNHRFTQPSPQPVVPVSWPLNTITITHTTLATITAFQTVDAPPSTITVTITETGKPEGHEQMRGHTHNRFGGWMGW